MSNQSKAGKISEKVFKNRQSSDGKNYGVAGDAYYSRTSQKSSADKSEGLKKTLNHNKPTSYQVGFAKPPFAHRFRPGVSGNPLGRPIGARNRTSVDEDVIQLRDLILSEASRKISVTAGVEKKEITMRQAVVKSLMNSAIKGDFRSQKILLELIDKAEIAKQNLENEFTETVAEYKASWDFEFRRRERLGIELPRPIPDPDHLIIDTTTGKVTISGPLTKEDADRFMWLEERKLEHMAEVKRLNELLLKAEAEEERVRLRREIKGHQSGIKMIMHIHGLWRPPEK